jgi:hypothetical protein
MLQDVNPVSILDALFIKEVEPCLGYQTLHIGVHKEGLYKNVCDWRKFQITRTVSTLRLICDRFHSFSPRK